MSQHSKYPLAGRARHQSRARNARFSVELNSPGSVTDGHCEGALADGAKGRQFAITSRSAFCLRPHIPLSIRRTYSDVDLRRQACTRHVHRADHRCRVAPGSHMACSARRLTSSKADASARSSSAPGGPSVSTIKLPLRKTLTLQRSRVARASARKKAPCAMNL